MAGARETICLSRAMCSECAIGVAEALCCMTDSAVGAVVSGCPPCPEPWRTVCCRARLKLAALQKKDGALKLSHFRRVKQLGSGDVGLVDLVQVQGDPESRYAMKTLEKREMLERNKVLSRRP